ncbi:bifunctional diguanylate cyclase/phosphodiesterase [Acetobacter vaccinii]|uniref:EAL domain-containing protein n=1 Tax=Acetobacter vaccinii TaxID=2592655 RepID=A0A5C1YPD8_9PROT|nr:EAL domain-containing protein [Acetobacter vaccinii]QEO16947.1 EAL domain-containing protein [Acetobacter vaccinii]
MSLWYGVSLGALLLCGSVIEYHDYRHVASVVEAEAQRDGEAYANLIAGRLNVRFTELEVASVALLGRNDDAASPLPEAQQSLRRYLLSRTAPDVFNVFAEDGERIQWSVMPQGADSDGTEDTFFPVGNTSEHKIGQIRTGEDTGLPVLPIRVHGATEYHEGYYLNTLYSIVRLLDQAGLADGQRDWTFDVMDTRNGALIRHGLGQDSETSATAAQDRLIMVPVAGYPFSVRVHVPKHGIWRAYRKQASTRWAMEALMVLLILGAGGLLIRRRDKEQMRHLQRLTEFNAFMAQINQCIGQVEHETDLLQEVCDMAIHYAHLKIAVICRPDEHNNISLLALSGPAHCMDGINVSITPSQADECSNLGRVWTEGEAIFDGAFETTNLNDQCKLWAQKYGVRSNAVLPIYRDGKIWAMLSVYHEQANIFDDQLKALLDEIVTDISRGLAGLYSRHLQNALLDNSVVGILLIKNMVIQLSNTHAAQMLGLPPGGLLNRPAEILYPDKQEYGRMKAAYEHLWDKGRVRVPGVRLARSDGHIMIADFSGVCLRDLSGDVSVWTMEDVTSRDLAQRLYHALLNTADAVLQATTEQETCDRTCADLVHDTLFHAVWIGKPDEAGTLHVVSHAGEGTDGIEELDFTIRPDAPFQPVSARAWVKAEVVYSNDELAEQGGASWNAFAQRNRWRAILAAPIWRGGKVWAVITFVSPHPQVFDEQSVAMCQRVADLLGHALDKLDAKRHIERMQEQEAERARHDPLTGLPNRLALEEYMPQALARARRYGTTVAVGMLDLDDFKQVNDTYGHEAGDRLLQELAQRIRQDLRETDYVVRLGGDEFVVVLEGLDALLPAEQAIRALDHLHTVVETPFRVKGDATAMVGMTLGLAFFPMDGDDVDTLLRRADAAMYQSKDSKATRKNWWCLASASTGKSDADEGPPEGLPFDAYGPQAQEILVRAKGFLGQLRQNFIERFYEAVSEIKGWDKVLAALTPEELERLKQRQGEHLDFLLAPETTRNDIERVAVRQGVMHALSGVDAVLLTEAYSLYRRLLIDSLDKAMLRACDRYQILLTTEIRLQDDKGAQLEVGQAAEQEYFSLLSDPLPDVSCVWPDASGQALQALGHLPGIQAALLFRMNAAGDLVVESSGGPRGQQLLDALVAQDLRPRLNPSLPTGRSITALAWRTRQIQSCASCALAPDLVVWSEIADRTGAASIMSLPIRQENGHVVAVLTLYGVCPSQFESLMMQQFARGLQQRWEQIWQRCYTRQAPVVTEERSRHLRECLFSGGLRMFMQPIVDLRSGELLEVEALARLREADGTIVSPAVFLPLLGREELDRLFQLGLEQGLDWLSRWDAQGLSINLSINMPPSCLLDADGPTKMEEALRQHGIAPQRLTVELLEMQGIDPSVQSTVIRRYKAMGVQMAIDDLGSGYSSLLRLSSLPFDIIKVDQGVLSHIHETPLQIFSVVKSVLDMGADFHSRVVVEGLEDAGMIEAMYYLGSRYGQGYGIARPMPPESFMDWHNSYKGVSTATGVVTTPLGALACHWMRIRSGQATAPDVSEGCPVAQWLDTSGLSDHEAARWHACSHDRDAYPDEARKFTDWLLEQVTQAANAKKRRG